MSSTEDYFIVIKYMVEDKGVGDKVQWLGIRGGGMWDVKKLPKGQVGLLA